MITVVPYNPRWPKLFANAAARIREALGVMCVGVHHVGSTAIPGLAAKPILDIMIVVNDRVSARESLNALGFLYKGEINIPFRDYYTWRGDPIHMNVHVVEPNSPELKTIVSFRDYLRAHDDMRDRYGDLKVGLAKDPDAGIKKNQHLPEYTLGKDSFIREVMSKTGVHVRALRFCIHHNEWAQYHHLCRTRIFDRLPITYDENHPSLADPLHTHVVLYFCADIVGVAHVEMLAVKGEAALRKIIVDRNHERQGHGQFILHNLEKWLREKGVHMLRLHAGVDAVSFYEKCGYTKKPFDDLGINPDTIDMGKSL